jgi:hypothetical protein
VKMARVILFTSRMEAMNKFYGDVLGLIVVSGEKAGGSLTPVEPASPCTPARRRPNAKDRRSSSMPTTSPPRANISSHAAQSLAKSARAPNFASATQKIPTATPSNFPTVNEQPFNS